MLYDGGNVWVTDLTADTLLKLNADGSIAQTINVGDSPQLPVFDGTNIWVPNDDSASVIVVRVKEGEENAHFCSRDLIRASTSGSVL